MVSGVTYNYISLNTCVEIALYELQESLLEVLLGDC